MPKAQSRSQNKLNHTQPYNTPIHSDPQSTMNSTSTMMPQFQRPSMTPNIAPASAPSERASVAWSNDDDNHLMEYRAKGYNWGQIASYFNGKTANACRKRHERLMEKKNSENYDTVKNEDLANAYMECREEMWKIIAARLGESKWQTIELKCMEKGLKNLQTYHRSRKGSRTHAGSPSSHFSGGEGEDPTYPDELNVASYQPQVSAPQQQYHQAAPQINAYSTYSNAGMYAPAYTTMPPPSTAPGNTLPPLVQGFTSNHHFPPPSFNMARNNGHMVSASYA